ncbi:MAG: helix-turn-helix domain-containing protein [Actinobacteria bacterium]|nr:helix-turn-helix domain-containing protein [Actinomycetota bacterium]
MERASALIALHCGAYRRTSVCVPIGDVVYALVPHEDDAASRPVRDLARDVIWRTEEALKVSLRAAIAAPVRGLGGLAGSRAEADRVLRVLARDPTRGPLASVEDVRSQTILYELIELARREPQLAKGRLKVLVEHDAKRGTSYVETLRAYLDAFGDVPAAAKATSVHPNTFRYRIRRLLSLAGLDLSDPDERLVVHLQLRLLAAGGQEPA